jgi:hypothetical protein
VTSAVTIVAENNFGDTRVGGLAGPMGLLIILLMAVATVLLIRNMNARIRRLPDRFPDQAPAELPDAGRPDVERLDQARAESQAADGHEPERNADDRRAEFGT